MALAMSKAAPLRADIKLSQALRDYEAVLTEEQKRSFSNVSPLESSDVIALTSDINRKNAGRKSRVWGTRLTTFLNSVKGFTTVVDVIIGGAGNLIAGTVWAVVKTAMQAASGFESYFDALSTMLMTVGQNAPRYEKYALLYPTSARLRQELCNYFSIVVNLCKATILFVRRPTISQALSALRKPFDDEFGKFRKDLKDFGDAVRDEVSLAAKQQQNLDSIEAAREWKASSFFRKSGLLFQQRTSRALEEDKKWRAFELRLRFLNACSTYNYETALNQARRKGKSSWLFKTDEYRKWKSADSSSILLCSGIVGAGKTIVSSSVVEELLISKEPGVSVAYFFCRDDDLQSLKVREIIGSLARQFLSGISVESFQKADRKVDGVIFNIEQIVTHLVRLAPSQDQYIIVLDGLDECEAEEVCYLFETLRTLCLDLTHVFKVFWTGRSDFVARVSSKFRPNHHVTISQSNNAPEISAFIELALDEALENGRLNLRDPRIIVEIQDALETNAHEMFLWVAFQIDSICRENTDDSILNALKNLPKDLPTTYRHILRRLPDSGGWIQAAMAKEIFQIVSAARRPLNVEELREAISIEPGNTIWYSSKLVNDMMKALDSCGSLLVLDEELSTVHFAHSSVKQHLETSPNRDDISGYHIVPREATNKLSKVILTYLNLDVLKKQIMGDNKASATSSSRNMSLLLRTDLSLPRGTSSNLARKLLAGRKAPQFDIGRELEKATGFPRSPKIQPLQEYSLLSYAQESWLFHAIDFNDSGWRIYELMRRLVEGDSNTVEVPWTSEDARTLNAAFLNSVAKIKGSALTGYVLVELMRMKEKGRQGMQKLLELLPVQVIPGEEKGWVFAETIEYTIKNNKVALLQLLLDKECVDVNGIMRSHTALEHALLWGALGVAKMLLEHGADANANTSFFSPTMWIAASCRLGAQAVLLLLDKGAREIPIKDLYSEDVKHNLQRAYDFHRKRREKRS